METYRRFLMGAHAHLVDLIAFMENAEWHHLETGVEAEVYRGVVKLSVKLGERKEWADDHEKAEGEPLTRAGA